MPAGRQAPHMRRLVVRCCLRNEGIAFEIAEQTGLDTGSLSVGF